MPSPDFLKSLPFILQWEGGYVNNPADPGGATNRGITQAVYDSWRQAQGQVKQDVRQLTDAELHALYESRYWNAAHCNTLEHALNLVHLDTAVNMGTGRAVRFLQAAVGAVVDGDYGNNTATCVASCDQGATIAKYCDTREAFYRGIVAAKPSSSVFLKGWLNRLDALRKAAGLPGFESDVPVDFGEVGYVAKVADVGEDAVLDRL